MICIFWVQDSQANKKALNTALETLGIAPVQLVKTLQFVSGWTNFLKDNGFPIDIMTTVKGLEHLGFEHCHGLRAIASLSEIEVPFLSLEHLLLAKRDTARPKDLLDIEELEKINPTRKSD